ncbi:MAG: hypothetical protein ACI9GW_003294, partial [Halieaceae bacterium]
SGKLNDLPDRDDRWRRRNPKLNDHETLDQVTDGPSADGLSLRL